MNNLSADRLIRDIEEGIIIVDNDGLISHINPKAKAILGISDDYIGNKYARLMQNCMDDNDEFHQMLIDAVADKNCVHKKTVRYNTADTQKMIYIASSMLKDDSGNQKGVILSFDDVTYEEKLKFKIKTSALIFIILVALLSVWMFICAIYINDPDPVNQTLFGRLIMYLPLLFTPIAINVCGFSKEDLGLSIINIKENIITDSIFTVIAVALMCIAKLLILKWIPSFTFYTAGGRFFDFTKYSVWGRLEYAICVIAQEYLSRGLVYECIKRIITTEDNQYYADAIAIIVSSLYFAALHIYLGVAYMIGAFVLLSIFGVIYRKQKSIWGLCIPHFVLGCMIDILGFTMF